MDLNKTKKMSLLANYVLVNIVPVIQNIFSWLNMKSLCISSQVCQLWADIIKQEIKRRNALEGFLVDIPKDMKVSKKGKKVKRSVNFIDFCLNKYEEDFLLETALFNFKQKRPFFFEVVSFRFFNEI